MHNQCLTKSWGDLIKFLADPEHPRPSFHEEMFICQKSTQTLVFKILLNLSRDWIQSQIQEYFEKHFLRALLADPEHPRPSLHEEIFADAQDLPKVLFKVLLNLSRDWIQSVLKLKSISKRTFWGLFWQILSIRDHLFMKRYLRMLRIY